MGVNLTGALTTVRAAATFAVVDTWYECTAATLRDAGAQSNRLAIMVTAATASPGTVDIYLEASPMDGADYDVTVPSEGPAIAASIPFSAVGTKMQVCEVDLVPNYRYKVWFRASANAASATVAIKCQLFQSDAAAGDKALLQELATNTTALAAAIATHDSAAVATGPQVMGRANTSQQTAVDDEDAARLALNAHGELVLASHKWANQADRVEEDDPLSAQYLVQTLIDNTAVAADPGASYAPSSTGVALAGYKDAMLQLYLKGGVDVGANDETVTVTLEATTGLEVSAAVRWVDITESCLDCNLGTDSHASFTAVGATAADYMIRIGSDKLSQANYSHIRVKYDWSGDPDDTNGAIVAELRTTAL